MEDILEERASFVNENVLRLGETTAVTMTTSPLSHTIFAGGTAMPINRARGMPSEPHFSSHALHLPIEMAQVND